MLLCDLLTNVNSAYITDIFGDVGKTIGYLWEFLAKIWCILENCLNQNYQKVANICSICIIYIRYKLIISIWLFSLWYFVIHTIKITSLLTYFVREMIYMFQYDFEFEFYLTRSNLFLWSEKQNVLKLIYFHFVPQKKNFIIRTLLN